MYVFGMILNTYIQSLEQVGMVCFFGQQSAEESLLGLVEMVEERPQKQCWEICR